MKRPSRTRATEPRQRLLELADAHGSSLAALSDLLGRNPSYLQQYVRKGSPRKLDERDRATLARFFGVPEAELGAPEDNSFPPAPSTAEWAPIPRLALDASAGPGAIAAEERPFDAFHFSSRWLREQGLEPAMLSAITVSGDSMEPLLRDGDEILVDRTPRPFREGIHVVRLGESLLVKQVQLGRPDHLTLISLNPHYRPIEVEAGEVDVIGRVVWKGGRL